MQATKLILALKCTNPNNAHRGHDDSPKGASAMLVGDKVPLFRKGQSDEHPRNRLTFAEFVGRFAKLRPALQEEPRGMGVRNPFDQSGTQMVGGEVPP